MKITIIGGGAAGFFAAISAKTHHPNAHVVILEKTSKLLSKVRVSGGGRCNVTNSETRIGELAKGYPRGGTLLKKLFSEFSTTETINWFERRGVRLKTEVDGRVFPVSDSSQTIIDCLLRETKKLGIEVKTNHSVESISAEENGFQLTSQKINMFTNKLIIASGGSPKREGLKWLEHLGHEICEPVPSLFTFNMPGNEILNLMGLVCEKATASIQGTKLKTDGPILITHWGMSGPAILKLSSLGAKTLAELGYRFNVQINWADGVNDQEVQAHLNEIILTNPNKILTNVKPFELPERLWEFLLSKANLPSTKKWNELGKKGLNKISNMLTNDIYEVNGKTTFKEEFVTCGGVSLESIRTKTMESQVCKGLYFAGEVLDIDGITGGYNFQAAWTTGFITGKLN